MIRTDTLYARATKGYNWLDLYGPKFGFTVNHLHAADYVNVQSGDYCPLAVASGLSFAEACSRLTRGAVTHGNSHRIWNLNGFLRDNGFSLDHDYTVLAWVLNRGSDRDWRQLTAAWRAIIADRRPASPVKP